MKKKVIIFCLLFTQISCFCQINTNDKYFVEYIKRLYSLYQIEDYKKSNIKVRTDKNYTEAGYYYTAFTYMHKEYPKKFINGGAILIKDKKHHPLLISSVVSFDSYSNCDSILGVLKSNNIEVDTIYSGVNSKCTFEFTRLDSTEVNYLNSIDTNMYHKVIKDYIDFFSFKKLFNTSFHFTENNNFGIDVLQNLYTEKKFSPAIKLMYTQNPLFNWMVAEFLNYANKQFNFLDEKTKQKISTYNGRNRFIKFRSNELLSKLYR